MVLNKIQNVNQKKCLEKVKKRLLQQLMLLVARLIQSVRMEVLKYSACNPIFSLFGSLNPIILPPEGAASPCFISYDYVSL